MKFHGLKLPRFSLATLITLLILMTTQIALADWISPPPMTVDNSGNVGQYSSLAVVNGSPAISYRDGTNNALTFARATDINGESATWNIVSVDAIGWTGQHTSLAVINGNPAISYMNAGATNDLKFARATDVDGTSWISTTVDSTGIVGAYTSLADVNGKPAISYIDVGNSKLKFARATDTVGSAWSTITLDGSSAINFETSLAIINGNPAISYYDTTDTCLKFIRADDADGTSWTMTPVTVDNSADVGRYSSLAYINGKPAISYWDASGDLIYAYANDANGASWNMVSVDSGIGLNLGKYTSLANINGRPAISYWDGDINTLKYVRASDASGAAWETPTSLDSGNCGGFTSLALVNGDPAIAYYGQTWLKYVRSDNPTAVTVNQVKPALWMNAALLPIALVLGVGVILLRRMR